MKSAEAIKNMCTSSNEQHMNHKAMSVLVAVAFFFVTVAINLFHSEDCHNSAATDIVSYNHLCPACVFLAGSDSMETSYGPALFITESHIILQPSTRLTLLNHSEWMYSITSRAPPLFVIS